MKSGKIKAHPRKNGKGGVHMVRSHSRKQIGGFKPEYTPAAMAVLASNKSVTKSLPDGTIQGFHPTNSSRAAVSEAAKAVKKKKAPARKKGGV